MTLAIFDIAALELLSSAIFWTYMAAAVGVVVGVFWEKENFSDAKRHRGWLLLLWALGTETALTIALHAVDNEIASRQRAVISSQQRTIEQILKPRQLSAEQKNRIAGAVKPFPPVPFISLTNPDAEPWHFALEISETLRANGWHWEPFPGAGLQALDGRPKQGTTMADHIEIQAPPELRELGEALAGAIKDPGVIGMDDVRLVSDDRIKIVTIIVGSKR